MNCEICRGACCEYMVLGPLEIRMPTRDSRRWVELHSSTPEELTFDVRCQKLSLGGWCDIYEGRPLLCRDFLIGGNECLSAVKLKRTPIQYQMIRGEKDPDALV